MSTITALASERIENVYLSLTVDTRKKSTTLPVAVRIFHNGRTTYYGTGYRVTMDQWGKLLKATGKGADKGGDLYADKVSQIKVFNKVRNLTRDLTEKDQFSIETLKVLLTGKTSLSFDGLWEDVIAELRKQGREGTAISYNCGLVNFRRHNGSNIDFGRITPVLINSWIKKILAEGSSPATAAGYMRSCRVVANESVRRMFMKQSQYPFGTTRDGKAQIPKAGKRKNQFVDISTILKIKGFVGSKRWEARTIEDRKEAVAYWLFSYLGNGLNMADIVLLKWNKEYFDTNGTILTFQRKKTINTKLGPAEFIRIPIIPELKEILDKYASVPMLDEYVFPQFLNGNDSPKNQKNMVRDWNSIIHDRMKWVCENLEITADVSMTWARHSFATNLDRKGVPRSYISYAMGHSNGDEGDAITNDYIATYPDETCFQYNNLLLQL